MATKSQEILLKGNTTNASAVPSSLKVREIAINALDRSLFTNDGNSIVKLYTGTTKWFDVNGNANNALKLGGILASEYINKEAFNSHINNSTIHITAAERTKWNNKWDYNEETIKAVKVNAAVNADKLGGYSITTNKNTPWRTIPYISNIGVMDVGMSFEFHFDNTTGSDFSTVLTCTGDYGNIVRLPSVDGTLALLTDNVASATKLATSRTLWGKPFDGSANVDGDLKDVGNITASGKATIQGDIISGGEVVAVVGEGTPAGVTDYSALTGKPQINGVTLVSGNNTLASLGIQAAGDYATNSGVAALLAGYADKTFVSNNYVGKSAFNAHTADTDIHITAAERKAWNAKWTYDEATIKAVKVTSASSADSVAWSGIKNKPTTFTPSAHTHTASDITGLPTSLKNPFALTFGSKTYDGSAAKTITASDLGALTAHQSIYAFTLQVNGTSQGVYNPASAAKTINIAVPTKTSQITNDSGFITSASIPTALKNPHAVEIKANGVSLGTYDGSKAATFNLSAANVGAANKIHTHTASEVSGLPTKLSAFTNDVGFITGITKSMVEGVLTGNITSHTHSYLPLSGGTLNVGYGSLIIEGQGDDKLIFNNTDGEKYQRIVFKEANTEYGSILVSSTGVNIKAPILKVNDKIVLHSGNYNSYTPTLTGTGASGTWGINISGNAATTTKLQDNTAFTAWGQTFFENGKPKNVSGDLSMERSKIYWNGDIKGSYISSRGMTNMTYNMRDGHIFQVEGDNILIIRKYGYKLQVYGETNITGDLIVDGEVSALVA